VLDPGGPMSTRIFVSYRREDAEDIAGRIRDRLVQVFHKENVFFDIHIKGGDDFDREIDRHIDLSQVLVAIIGPKWLEIIKQRENNESKKKDWVRYEIAQALEKDVRVIPVRVLGAELPAEGDLPMELKRLCKKQAIEVISGEHFDSCCDRLIRQLEEGTPPKPPTPTQSRHWDQDKGRWQGLSAVVAALLILVMLWWWRDFRTPPSQTVEHSAISFTTTAGSPTIRAKCDSIRGESPFFPMKPQWRPTSILSDRPASAAS
jgi:hypothetical protein